MRFLQSYALFGMTILVFMLFLSTHAHAQCASPVGAAGDMTYNDNDEVVQWCDGTNWNGINTPPYIPNGVDFNSTAYLETPGSLSDVGDTKIVTISFWAKLGDNVRRVFDSDGIEIEHRISSRDSSITMYNDANAVILNREGINNLSGISNKWAHFIFSVDLGTPGSFVYYQNDTANALPNNNITIDDFINADSVNTIFVGCGNNAPGTACSSIPDVEMADIWIDYGTYLDLSDVNNRRKFIDANGWPVDLGADGSRATGSAPDIFLSGDTATWHTNDGTGGGFTENGALTDALSNPGENLGPTGGLIGWWKLDETGGLTAADSSPTANDGTFNGEAAVPTTDGTIKGGMSFDGSNDYVTIPDNAAFDTITNEITLSIWMNKIDAGSGWRAIFTRPLNNSSFLDLWCLFLLPNQNYTFYHNLLGAHANIDSGYNSNLDIGQWVHLAVTYDGTTLRIYRNGVELANQNIVGGSFANTNTPAAIGADSTNGGVSYSEHINAHLDDARVYNRALSPTEITELYDTGMPCKNPLAQRGGDMMYNTTHHVPQYCNNREWRAMGAQPGDGGAGCSNPTGAAGDFNYETNNNVMTYCEGDEWRAVAF